MAATLGSATPGSATAPGGWVPDQAPGEVSSRPSGVLRGRVDLGRPGLLTLAAVALVAALGAGLLAWRARPVELPAAAPSPVPSSVASSVAGAVGAAGAPPAAPPAGPRVLVHVTGKVQRPGVVELPAGARVVDALRAAGGLRAGVDPGTLNLARRVVDGEQIVAGAPFAAAASPPAVTADGGLVDLNAASVSDLDALPGVGPVLAQRIVDWRTRHGPFRDVGQLRDVDGIGEQRFEDLRDRVRV